MTTWGWNCSDAECPARAGEDRQRYRTREAAVVAAKAHTAATGHASEVVEYR
jgi:hypothetical protein